MRQPAVERWGGWCWVRVEAFTESDGGKLLHFVSSVKTVLAQTQLDAQKTLGGILHPALDDAPIKK
jgi:hypothetical protein